MGKLVQEEQQNLLVVLLFFILYNCDIEEMSHQSDEDVSASEVNIEKFQL